MFSDFKVNLDGLLEKVRTLTIEIFKFLSGLSPPIMNEVFQVKPSILHFLRDNNELYNKNPKTVTYGT